VYKKSKVVKFNVRGRKNINGSVKNRRGFSGYCATILKLKFTGGNGMAMGVKQAKIELILTMTLFGTIALIRRFIPLPSSLVAEARSFIGCAFLLLFAVLCGKKLDFSALKKNLVPLILGGAGLGLGWLLLFEAYRYTSVAVAILCNYLGPVLVIIGSVCFFDEKMNFGKFVCVCMAVTGILLVSGVLQNGMPEGNNMVGIICGIVSAFFFALTILVSKKLSGIRAYEKTVVQLGVSALVLLPYLLYTEKLSTMQFTPLSVSLLILLGVVHTGVTYMMYFHALEYVSLQTFSFFAYIEPVLTIILSAIVLKEPVGFSEILGACLILGATFVAERSS